MRKNIILFFVSMLCSRPVFAANSPAALILSDKTRLDNVALATEAARAVGEAGYAVGILDAAAFPKPINTDLPVLEGAGGLSRESIEPVVEYLRRGGKIMALGLPGWDAQSEAPIARLDTLTPATQFYQVHGAAFLAAPPELALLTPIRLKWPAANADCFQAMQPRPRGIGFDQQRPWRWQPLLEARASDNDYRGAIATLLIHFHPPFTGGVWASFSPSDAAFYHQPEIHRMLRETASAIRRGLFLEEGGSEFFTVFDGQSFRLGARTVNFSAEDQDHLAVRIAVRPKKGGRELFSHQWPLRLTAGQEQSVEESWLPPSWPRGGLRVSVELPQNDKVIDRLEHDLNVWRPNPHPNYVEIRDGGFQLKGKPWKPYGVNYMPSSGISTDNGNYYELWLGKGAYDPDVIAHDLHRIRAMNLNAVSIFVYHESMTAQHLLDFLRQCEALGLHVNQSLRPGTPLDFRWPEMKDLIEFFHMAQNDTIFAYDLAWEPHHENEQATYGKAWLEFVIHKYGSLDDAARHWGVPAPAQPSPDSLDVPPHHQLAQDGPWRKLVADYRAFLDDYLRDRYAEARRLVKSIDPHHAVSFRMAHAGDPTFNQERMIPFDFYGLVNAVDIWEPEAYGRIGDWNRVRDAEFEVSYARLCDPTKPLVWAEMGNSVWDPKRRISSSEKMEFQGRYFRDFHRMMIESGVDGIFYWWYPGGWRLNENSDFGIINPDGTDRPATKAIRDNAEKFLHAPKPPKPNYFIPVDRDADARGLVGMYATARDAYWKAVSDGKTPALTWKSKPGEK